MTLNRITTALLIIEIAAVVLLLGGTISRAVGLDDFGVSMPQSLDVEFISQESGLNGTRYETCTGDIFSLFNDNLDEMAQRWLEDTARAMLENMTNMLMTKALCYAQSQIGKLTIGALTAVTRVLGFSPECNNISASDMAAQMMQEAKDRLKRNFLVSCSSTVGYDYVSQTVAGMIQTQGPDGGMAAATDWSAMQNRRPAEMAQRQWWTMLANTNICPWFRDDVLDKLGVPQSYRENAVPISANGYRIDEKPPFELRAECTLPEGFDISDTSEETMRNLGGYAILEALMEPQNNPDGFMDMALSEFAQLKAARQNEAANQLVAGGGFTGTFGECAKDPNGKCVDDGAMKVVPGALRDYNAAEVNSYYTRLADATGEEGLLNDVAAQLQVRMLDMANAPLPLELELGSERTETNFTPNPAPTSTGTPANPTCAPEPGCQCVPEGSPYLFLQSLVASAVDQAIIQYPLLFSGSQVIGDRRLALEAICDEYDQSQCSPHPSRDDQIVIIMGGAGTVTFTLITPDNYLDTTGGIADQQCPPGVLD